MYYGVISIFLSALLFNTLETVQTTLWDQSKFSVKQGDNVTITCTATDVDRFDVLRLFQQKCLHHDDKSTIADDEHLKTEFLTTGRYSIAFKHDPNTNTSVVTLTYTGIRGEDAGYIGCYKLSNKKKPAYSYVNVLVPVEEMYMATMLADGTKRREQNSSTVELEEGASVACVVVRNGTDKAARTKLMLDGKDYTQHFVKTKQHKTTVSASGNKYVHNKLTLRYSGETPPIELNKRELLCVAQVAGFPLIFASLTVNVQFAPVITCKPSRYYAKLSSSLQMSCEVRAEPMGKIHWKYGDEEETSSLIGENDQTTSVVNTTNEDTSSVQLSISNLEERHFTKYYITASNVHGSQTAQVEILDEAMRPKEDEKTEDGRYKIASDKSVASKSDSRKHDVITLTMITCLMFALVWA